jgi:hypothetical protein
MRWVRIASAALALTLGAREAMAQVASPLPAPPLPPPLFQPQAPALEAAPPAAGEVLLGPEELPYEEGQRIPPGYYVRRHEQQGLIIGGAVTFGGLYVASAFMGVVLQLGTDLGTSLGCIGRSLSASVGQRANEPCESKDDYVPMLVPLAGPFLAMDTANPDTAGTIALGALGIGQAAGVALLVTGLATRDARLLRNDVTGSGVTVTPAVGPGFAGAAVGGAF